jgi:perosamine synthetase
MTVPPSPSWASPSGWLYSLLCENGGVAYAVVEHMRAKGIEARKFWRSLSERPVYSASPAFLTGVSQKISGSVVSLPSSSSLTDDQLKRVIEELKAFNALGESKTPTA